MAEKITEQRRLYPYGSAKGTKKGGAAITIPGWFLRLVASDEMRCRVTYDLDHKQLVVDFAEEDAK